MTLKVIHKHGTSAGTPPVASDLDVGELAINAADAEIYTKDTNGNVKKFANAETTENSASVNFTQDGTGAVTRTVESKLKDTVSVEDFGAVPDGTVDNKTIFNNATASSGGKPVSIASNGSFAFSSDVVGRFDDYGILEISGDRRIIDSKSRLNDGNAVPTNVTFDSIVPAPAYATTCPKASDLSLRYLYVRSPGSTANGFDGSASAVTGQLVDQSAAFAAASAFHADRIDWVYLSATDNSSDANIGQSLGPGTIAPDSASKTVSEDGENFVAASSIPVTGAINTATSYPVRGYKPWQFGLWTINPYNETAIYRTYLWAKGAIDAGAQAVFIDNMSSLDLYSSQGKFLDEMRIAMPDNTLAPSTSIGGYTKALAPTAVAFDASSFDYLSSQDQWAQLELNGQRFGSRKIVSSEYILEVTDTDGGLEGYKKSFALAYANGQIFQLPWDIFLFNQSGRLYATAAQFANFSGFVKACKSELEGYEGVNYVTRDTRKDPRWQVSPLQIIANSNDYNLALVARAKAASSTYIVHAINQDYPNTSTGDVKIGLRKDSVNGTITTVNGFKPRNAGFTGVGRDTVTVTKTEDSVNYFFEFECPSPWVILSLIAS